jgi:beta-glucosidase
MPRARAECSSDTTLVIACHVIIVLCTAGCALQAALAGLDQQMPDDSFFGAALEAAVNAGTVPQSVVDDKVLRILTSMYTAGLFDRPASGSLEANVTSAAHNALARTLAAGSMVLVQNKGALPLSATKPLNIVVAGDACDLHPIVHGGGSGQVVPAYVITALLGIKTHASSSATITYFTTAQQDAAVAAAKAADVAVVCTATTSSEGSDRPNLSLPAAEDALTAAVLAVQVRVLDCVAACVVGC